MTRSQKIKKVNFRLIEAELYGYQETINELAEIREEIAEEAGTNTQQVLNGLKIGASISRQTTTDGTYSKVERRNSKHLLEVEKRIRAIENTLEQLKVIEAQKGERLFRLVQLKYFEHRLTDFGITQELNISYSTFRRWRRTAIVLVAEKLGWEI